MSMRQTGSTVSYAIAAILARCPASIRGFGQKRTDVGLRLKCKASEAGKAMITKVDYFSYTIATPSPFGEIGENTREYITKAFISQFPDETVRNRFSGDWSLEAAKGFYSARLRHEPTGVALSFGTVNAHIYVELSGKACDCLESIDALAPLISLNRAKCSRLDIATDFLTEVDPEQFAAFRNDIRWKYASVINSASGKTVYVGSRTGERMARVYRYNEPHPRAKYLRVECEYKGKAAKAIAEELELSSLEQVCMAANVVFGWKHDIWVSQETPAVKVPYSSHSPENAATVRWLYGVVATSVSKAISEGLIDWNDFVSKIFPEGAKDMI